MLKCVETWIVLWGEYDMLSVLPLSIVMDSFGGEDDMLSVLPLATVEVCLGGMLCFICDGVWSGVLSCDGLPCC